MIQSEEATTTEGTPFDPKGLHMILTRNYSKPFSQLHLIKALMILPKSIKTIAKEKGGMDPDFLDQAKYYIENNKESFLTLLEAPEAPA